MQAIDASDAPQAPAPSPARILDTLLFGHARVEALKAAIELQLFTAIAEGWRTTETLAERCNASERGIRTLCDFLAVNGFLTKSAGEYALTQDTRTFLDTRSPLYMGSVAQFLASPKRTERFASMLACVREGHSVLDLSDDVEGWVTFAHAMIPIAAPAAAGTAHVLGIASAGPIRVLDVAAGHGEYGLAIARENAEARIVGLDFPEVVAVARGRAQDAGFGDRYEAIEGSAFDVEFGGPYDIVLLPNFLHHFSIEKNERFLKKVAAAVKPGGRIAVVEFVPNDDRISPPPPAMFSMMMLTHTTGDAYTFAELDAMLRSAGFGVNGAHPAPRTPQTIIVSARA